MIPLLLLCMAVRAAEIEHLGVISQRRAVVLESCTNRTDFLHFRIAIKSGTNIYTLIRTNDLLTLVDLERVPDGPIIMGVQSVCQDGHMSPVALFWVTVSRQEPSAPRARVTIIGDTNQSPTFTNALNLLQAERALRVQEPLTPAIPNGGPINAMQSFYNHNPRYREPSK